MRASLGGLKRTCMSAPARCMPNLSWSDSASNGPRRPPGGSQHRVRTVRTDTAYRCGTGCGEDPAALRLRSHVQSAVCHRGLAARLLRCRFTRRRQPGGARNPRAGGEGALHWQNLTRRSKSILKRHLIATVAEVVSAISRNRSYVGEESPRRLAVGLMGHELAQWRAS